MRAGAAPTCRDSAADHVEVLAPHIREREARARQLIDAVAVDLDRLGLLKRADLPAVLLVGSGTSDGWVAQFHDEPTLFLALELLGDSPHDDLLIMHESLHVAHARASTLPWPGPVGVNLYVEGLAVALSRRLRPGHQDSDYLWCDDTHDRWVGECRDRQDEIRQLVSDNLDSTDPVLLQRLFSAPDDSPVPARCGYSLGDQIVTALLRDTAPAELFRWDIARLATCLRACGLNSSSRGGESHEPESGRKHSRHCTCDGSDVQ